jgi:hypothetical protein
MPRPPRPSRALAGALLVLAAVAAAPGEARAHDDPASGGAIKITADPPRLLLGRDAGAELRVTVPAGVQDVQLTASVGRIDEVRRLPEGGFAARYRPSGERVPQVAILAAVGRTANGAEDGWLAIPLSGQGDAKVRAAPGTHIELRIGERTFGPRKARADGVAVIPIVVPPGVREAHHGFRPIDLRIPETPLVHAVLDRSVVFADRQERVRVFAYGVAPHGAARRGDAPIFEPSRGTVAQAAREPGVVTGVWTLPPGRAGEERLVVRLPSSPATRAVLRLEAVAGLPAIVAVSFDRDALVARATEEAAVTARALDAGGNVVPAAITLSADGGTLDELREREPGTMEARLRVASFEGRREVRVTASLPGAGISGSRALPLRPGEPALARFDDPDGVLRSNGRRVARLRLSVADRYGNAVEATPAVTAERGKVLAVSASGAGAWDVSYVGPVVAGPTSERLVASVGPVKANAHRVLLPPDARWALAPTAGVALDLRGRFRGARSGVAVERAADARIRAVDADVAWRGEAELVAAGEGAALALLAGGSAARALAPTLVLRGSASGGAIVADGGVAPAGRLALGAGLMRGRIEPFVEAALLLAGRGAPGAFAAVGVSAGIRLGWERR